jgi:hypothetical protein
VGSGPIIRLFAASHILSSNGLGKRTIVTLLHPKCLTKKNKGRPLSAIDIQIGINLGVAGRLLANKAGGDCGPMRLKIQKIGDQRGPAGLVAGAATAAIVRVVVLVK